MVQYTGGESDRGLAVYPPCEVLPLTPSPEALTTRQVKNVAGDTEAEGSGSWWESARERTGEEIEASDNTKQVATSKASSVKAGEFAVSFPSPILRAWDVSVPRSIARRGGEQFIKLLNHHYDGGMVAVGVDQFRDDAFVSFRISPQDALLCRRAISPLSLMMASAEPAKTMDRVGAGWEGTGATPLLKHLYARRALHIGHGNARSPARTMSGSRW
jgi:hypothetical protein